MPSSRNERRCAAAAKAAVATKIDAETRIDATTTLENVACSIVMLTEELETMKKEIATLKKENVETVHALTEDIATLKKENVETMRTVTNALYMSAKMFDERMKEDISNLRKDFTSMLEPKFDILEHVMEDIMNAKLDSKVDMIDSLSSSIHALVEDIVMLNPEDDITNLKNERNAVLHTKIAALKSSIDKTLREYDIAFRGWRRTGERTLAA